MNAHKVRLLVVTSEDGRIIGTSALARDADGGPQARLVAGPGQRVREVEVEVDEKLMTARDPAALHAHVHKHLRGTGTGGKKK